MDVFIAHGDLFVMVSLRFVCFVMGFSDCRLLRVFQTYVFIACGHLFWMVLCPDMGIQCLWRFISNMLF